MDNILEKYSSYIKNNNNVYSPKNDKLTYNTTTLKNNLRIFFVETKESNISSATMYVGVGSRDNPKDLDGLAHYLEHMLFMGSDQYPGETFFQKKVLNNGGSTNAYTADNHTQYYFHVSEGFNDVIKIFSRFFIKPIFDVKYVEKEVSAVDSEHNKNIGSDGWRSMYLSGKFFIDGINDRFNTGNKETLLGDAVNKNPEILRERLVDFYNKYYSADKMILFISHNHIDDKFISHIEKLFEEVPSHDTLYTKNIAQFKELVDEYEIIKIKTINENNYLSIKWLIDGSDKFNDKQLYPYGSDVLSRILGHESDGSLYYILVKLGLIIDIMAGVDDKYDTNCIFSIEMKLTDKGYKHMEDILYIIDSYIGYLTYIDEKTPDMFNDFSEENNQIALLHVATVDTFDGLSVCQYYADVYNNYNVDLHYLPICSLLIDSKNIRHTHFKKILELLRLNRAKVLITSALIDDSKFTEYDKYYDVKYNHQQMPINKSMQSRMSKIKFTLPPINIYIPRNNNMQIIDTIAPKDPAYTQIASNNNNIYYVKRGNTYNTYTISGAIFITLDAMKQSNPTKTLAILIYMQYIEKLIQSELYLLSMAKISISVVPGKDSLVITMLGYDSDTGIDYIFEKILNYYWNLHTNKDIDIDTYCHIYEDIKTEMQNYQYAEPFTQISSEFKSMINDYYPTNEQMYMFLHQFSPKNMNNEKNEINYKSFKKYCVGLISQGFVTGVFGGSINMKKINRIINFIDTIIKPSNEDKMIINIPKNKLSTKHIKYNKNPNNKETAIGYGLYIGNMREKIDSFEWTREKPMCMLLEGYISGKFSASVRTEKQIGYVALSAMLNVNKKYDSDVYLVFILQSTRTDLEKIVEEYVDKQMLADIMDISNEEFETMKNSIIRQLNEKPLNISAECDKKLSDLIDSFEDIRNLKDLDIRFARNQLIIHSMKDIKLNMFVDFTKKILSNPRAVILISPKKSKN